MGLIAEQPWLVWAIAGVVLGILEVVVPGVYLIWLGAAALLTGLLGALLPIPVAAGFGVFALLAVATVGLARLLIDEGATGTADMLNDRGAQLIGTTVEVIEPIRAGRGRVRIGDGAWIAAGPDMPAGALATVVFVDGATVMVAPALPGPASPA